MTVTTFPRRAIAVLLIAAAALFVIGVRAEGDEDTHTDEPASEAETTQREEATEAAGGEAEAHEASEATEQGESSEQQEAAVLPLDGDTNLTRPPKAARSVVLAPDFGDPRSRVEIRRSAQAASCADEASPSAGDAAARMH